MHFDSQKQLDFNFGQKNAYHTISSYGKNNCHNIL